MKTSPLRIALAQYPLLPHASLADWQSYTSAWVDEAVKNNSRLLVFPEYCSTDLAAIGGENSDQTADDLIFSLQKYRESFVESFAKLAKKHNIYIVAGTFPCREGDKYFNRSYFLGPDGVSAHQDKLMLTRFEREKTSLSAGEGVTVFRTEFGLFAIAVCFDVQFPLAIRTLADAGCNLLIVPSCTGGLAGYNRVRTGCLARALENQMAVVQTVTVGDAKWQCIADTNRGAAGAFGPPDHGFPDNGIIISGAIDEPTWVYADIDFSAYENVRKNGHVLNWKYWEEQGATCAFPINEVVFN